MPLLRSLSIGRDRTPEQMPRLAEASITSSNDSGFPKLAYLVVIHFQNLCEHLVRVFAKQRRRPARGIIEAGELERRTGKLQRADRRVWHFDQHLAGGCLRISEDPVDRIDRSARHAGSFELLQPF